MPTDISEKELETILVSYLRDHQGYEEAYQATTTRSLAWTRNE